MMTLETEGWIIGYVGAANDYVLHRSIDEFPAPPAIFEWIDRYCLTHQDDRISVATQAFLHSVFSK